MVYICPGGNCTSIAIFFFDKVSDLKHLSLHPIRPGIFWTFLDPRGGGGDLPLSFFVFFPLFFLNSTTKCNFWNTLVLTHVSHLSHFCVYKYSWGTLRQTQKYHVYAHCHKSISLFSSVLLDGCW